MFSYFIRFVIGVCLLLPTALSAMHQLTKTNTSEKKGAVDIKLNAVEENAEETVDAVPIAAKQSTYPPLVCFDNIERYKLLIDLVRKEKKGIWGAFYSCNEPSFIEAWSKMHAQKLRGCLLLNGGTEEKLKLEENKACELLSKAGLPIRRVKGLPAQDNSQMHNKILFFEDNDGMPLIAIGSWNPTQASFKFNFEDMIIITDPNTIAYYVAELRIMLKESVPENEAAVQLAELAIEYADAVKQSTKFPAVTFRSDIKDVIKNLISWESKKIDGAQFVFIWETIVELWEKRNVSGSLLVDRRYKDVDKEKSLALLRRLQQKGIKCFSIEKKFWYGKNGKPDSENYCCMHHKFLIFRNNINKRPVLLTGSANMSDQSLDNNWENAFATEDPELIQKFKTQLKALKELKDFSKLIDPIPEPLPAQAITKIWLSKKTGYAFRDSK